MTASAMSASEYSRVPTKMPRSTQPLVCAAPTTVSLWALNWTSCTPLLYAPLLLSQPEYGTTTRPCVVSIVNALNVPAAGVHAQPLPNCCADSSAGDAGLVASMYCSDT